MTSCPFCAEAIQDAATVCKHCHRDLTGRLHQVEVVPRTRPLTWVVAGLVALVTLSLFYQACFGTMI